MKASTHTTIATYPPGPKGVLPGSLLMAFRRDPIKMMMGIAHRYGDIAYFKIGSRRFYLLSHPDYIEDVLATSHRNFIKSRGLRMAKRILGEGLLTSEGDFHRRQRRLSQPAFHRGRIASYGAAMTDYGRLISDRWKDGKALNIHEEMMRLTLAIVAKTLFGADVESEAKEIGEALTAALALFNRITSPFAEILDKLPLPSNRRFQWARERLDETIYRIIEERRSSGEDRGDLLSMLFQAQDVEGDGGRMTDLQLRDEIMTIFLAGHETTANALTWTWYLLSEHPEVESKLHAELDAVLQGRLPAVEDVPQLRYAEMVFTEAIRLYPPAWVVGRQALNDYPVDNYTLPAGSTVFMSPYVIHHDPRYFPDPDRFHPERWTPEMKMHLPKFAYFPFGGGPRLCIGEQFARMEGILLIAAIAQRWQMRLMPGHRVSLQPRITLRPKYGMVMIPARRKVGM